jgi:hypothetical protein
VFGQLANILKENAIYLIFIYISPRGLKSAYGHVGARVPNRLTSHPARHPTRLTCPSLEQGFVVTCDESVKKRLCIVSIRQPLVPYAQHTHTHTRTHRTLNVKNNYIRRCIRVCVCVRARALSLSLSFSLSLSLTEAHTHTHTHTHTHSLTHSLTHSHTPCFGVSGSNVSGCSRPLESACSPTNISQTR